MSPTMIALLSFTAGALFMVFLAVCFLAFGEWSAKHYLPGLPPKIVTIDGKQLIEWFEYDPLSKSARKRHMPYEPPSALPTSYDEKGRGIDPPSWYKK